MNAHWFSKGGGNEFAVFVEAEGLTYDRENTLIPITRDYSVWAWVREGIEGGDSDLARMAYVRQGEINEPALAVLHAGRAAMDAALAGDRAAVEAAYARMVKAGAPMEPPGYWVDRWMKDRS